MKADYFFFSQHALDRQIIMHYLGVVQISVLCSERPQIDKDNKKVLSPGRFLLMKKLKYKTCQSNK